jgi:hypothetical protein
VEILMGWLILGVPGVMIQRRWYRRRHIKQETPVTDGMLNLIYGPIGTIASWVAYR